MITKRTITQWVLLVKEREETEVKKDIEWAKNKIDLEVIRRIGREDPHFYVNVGLKMALDFLNQLDEPETLSPDWIGDNVEYAYYMTPKGTYSSAKAVIDPNKLENLLVPKQEKVVVGKEDAENIVDYKEMGWTLSHLIDDYGEDARHDELLAKAWLAYPNIEVEEEQKYIVKLPLPGHKTNDFAVVDIYGDIWLDSEWPSHYKMTEEEIKSLPKGEVYFEHFAKRVEELEENGEG